MPEPTTNDFVVTSYVNQNYSGSYQTHHVGGYTYREYDNARGTFWYDNDRDGWFEYGRRDDGYGDWSTFEGYYWDDVAPPPPRFPTEIPEEIEQNCFAMEPELALESATELFSTSPAPLQAENEFSQPASMSTDDGWFL